MVIKINNLQKIVDDLKANSASSNINDLLSGVKLIDHVIWAVETALELAPDNQIFAEDYKFLRQAYPLHFKSGEYHG